MRRYRSKVTDRGARFIANFEGGASKDGWFRPYYDKAGRVWTQGYGHTQGVHRLSKPWSPAKAQQVLRDDLNRTYAPPVARLCKAVGLRLEQHEFNALVSAAYNLGPGVFDLGRTLGDAVRSKNRARISDAFLVYDKAANGERLAGLTRRRRAERAMFISGRDLS